MATLYTKIKLYLEANSKTWDKTKVSLQDDGSGPYIKNWTYDIAQPNDSKIAEYETVGNTAETLQGVLSARQLGYSKIGDQLDKLWHDIDDEKLDKNGSWYKAIKAVKDANPKG